MTDDMDMKKVFLKAVSITLCIAAICVLFTLTGCKPPEADAVAPAENTADGTLKYEESADGKTVKISYEVDGELKSYTVSNNTNYTSGGFGGTDDLGRTLPTSIETGFYGENGEYYVCLFYFLRLDVLGISDYNEIYTEFKWADADSGITFKTMEDFYCYGDVAPLGRLNYIYQNYIPK